MEEEFFNDFKGNITNSGRMVYGFTLSSIILDTHFFHGGTGKNRSTGLLLAVQRRSNLVLIKVGMNYFGQQYLGRIKRIIQ